jgi:xylose isomerase
MNTFFPNIPVIPYEGPSSKNPLAFRYYNANEIVLGKPMKDWLRFSVCYWHTFRGVGADMFGQGTQQRPWDNGSESVENAIQRLRAAFEFFVKLGVEYWTFHDRDIAPVGATLEETNRNLDQVAQVAKELQKQTGVKLLWGKHIIDDHPV